MANILNRITCLVILTSFFIACDGNKEKEKVFQSAKLIGKYKVDISPIVQNATDNINTENDFGELGKGIAKLALSSVEIEINFYKENKGVIHIDAGLLGAFDDDLNGPKEFEYKVEDDSILYMRKNNESSFKRWAVVYKYSENYDYLQFRIIENGKNEVYYNLKKIVE